MVNEYIRPWSSFKATIVLLKNKKEYYEQNNSKYEELFSGAETKYADENLKKRLELQERISLKKERKRQLRTEIAKRKMCLDNTIESHEKKRKLASEKHKLGSVEANNNNQKKNLEQLKANYIFYKSMYNFRVKCL